MRHNPHNPRHPRNPQLPGLSFDFSKVSLLESKTSPEARLTYGPYPCLPAHSWQAFLPLGTSPLPQKLPFDSVSIRNSSRACWVADAYKHGVSTSQRVFLTMPTDLLPSAARLPRTSYPLYPVTPLWTPTSIAYSPGSPRASERSPTKSHLCLYSQTPSQALDTSFPLGLVTRGIPSFPLPASTRRRHTHCLTLCLILLNAGTVSSSTRCL